MLLVSFAQDFWAFPLHLLLFSLYVCGTRRARDVSKALFAARPRPGQRHTADLPVNLALLSTHRLLPLLYLLLRITLARPCEHRQSLNRATRWKERRAPGRARLIPSVHLRGCAEKKNPCRLHVLVKVCE